MESQGDVLGDIAPRLALADALRADDEPWVVCSPVTGDGGEIVDFRYLLANAAAEESVGLGPMAGHGMIELVPEAGGDVFAVFCRVLATGTRHRSISRNLVREGQHVWVPGWTALDVRRVGDVVVAHWRDATAEHETTVAAEHLQLSREIGSLAPGKAADLIAVRGDPLVDVRELERVHFVMKGGLVQRLER